MKTIKIFLKICELNLKKLLIYRASFAISLVLMGIWVLAYVTLIEVIFSHTKTLAGWHKGEVLLIMTFYYFIQNIADIFFKDNFEDFGENMRRGELDFKLVKPTSPRLLAFFWEIRFDHIAGIVATGFLFAHAWRSLEKIPSLPFLGLAFMFLFVSIILYYSILSFIATLTFWVERNETFNTLIFNVSQLSRYPRQIYSHIVGKILTFGIPLALIATIPVEVAVRFQNGYLPLFFIASTAIFYGLSRLFWYYGIRRYTSAN